MANQSSASLDVEACVRLLPIIAAWHKDAMHGVPESTQRDFHEQVVKMAGALASALPGMGKDSEPSLADVLAWLRNRPGESWKMTILDIEEATLSLRAARAAQPEETSDAAHPG